MLYILYGTAVELGRKCIDHLHSKGLKSIDKYTYVEDEPLFQSRFGNRTYLNKEDFYKKTDSLFRYRVANFQNGFSWEQISEAVYGKQNRLLTCAAADIGMLRKIKEVYKENVRIIYCYIETDALEGMLINLSEMSVEEYGSRMDVGLSIKQCYSQNVDLFDDVIIYGGERSVFNYENLLQQLDAVVDIPSKTEYKNNQKYDVFLCLNHNDTFHSKENQHAQFIAKLMDSLASQGLSVFTANKDIVPGCDWAEQIREAMSMSRVFMPIISQGSLKSAKVKEELEFAVQSAKNSALVIKPISLDGAVLPEWMNHCPVCHVQSEHYQSSVENIADWLNSMFTGEAALIRLSDKIDTYISVGNYQKAAELQRMYLTDLQNYLSSWERQGTVEKINARIKYLALLLRLNEYEIGSRVIDLLLCEMTEQLDDAFYDKIANSLVEFCVAAEISADEMCKKIDSYLHIPTQKKEKFKAAFYSSFHSGTLQHMTSKQADVGNALTEKIAAYSNASVELFEALFEFGVADGYRQTLITAYNRIIDYCKTVSTDNDISDKCIERVDSLKTSPTPEFKESEVGKNTLHSLKVYLGQALPNTGDYDVFISHKSADDLLADKVYEYLKKSGFEVFCDHHTLGELRDSNYDKRVMQALEKSKHLILVASSPDYVKDGWVYEEWHHFHNDKRDKIKNGNLIMVLSDDLISRKPELPVELRDGYEIIKTGEFRNKINNYLW